MAEKMQQYTPTSLIALTPGQMEEARGHLIGWCESRLSDARTQVEELGENFEIAKRQGWRRQAIQSALSRARRKVLFYEKVKLATEAGYLIVPDFPVNEFAIRVKRDTPQWVWSTIAWERFEQHPQNLPAGEGRYVDPLPIKVSLTFKERKGDKIVDVDRYRADEYNEVEFPLAIAKPVIVEKTADAMSLRVFDSLGTVGPPSGRGDPIVVGTIIRPVQDRQPMNFFIAWWLDQRDL